MVDLDNINVQFIDPAPVIFEFGFTNFATVEEVPAFVYVNKVGANSDPVTVDFFTSNGLALAGSEYVATNGTLSFGPDDIIHLIPIPIVDNTNFNGAKTFSVTLTNAGAGTTLAGNTTATIT
ncbi:MAG: Calx-beta domain-containing protein, partial [Limisphaerales bacterium]